MPFLAQLSAKLPLKSINVLKQPVNSKKKSVNFKNSFNVI